MDIIKLPGNLDIYHQLYTDTIFSLFTTTCIIFYNSDDDSGDDQYDDDSMDISQEIETPKTSRQQLPKKPPRQLPAKNKTEVTRKNPVCPDCKKKFLKIKILEVHYRKRHNESPMPYTCRHCQKGYFTAPGLEMHVVQFHEDEESDDMAQSDSDDDELSSEDEVAPVKSAKKSNKQTSLKSEKTSSAVNKESQHIFHCLQCPVAFFEKTAFEKHKNEAHKVSSVVTDVKKNKDLLKKMTDEQRTKYEALLDEVAMSAADEMEASTILLCPDCDKYFRKRSDLEAHKKNKHDVNNKTQQNIKAQDVNNKTQESTAPSTISEVSDVSEQKQKPVKSGSICPVCGKNFMSNCGLGSHLRSSHPHYKKSYSITSASSPSYKKPVTVSPASAPKSKPASEKPNQNAPPVANEVGEDTIKCSVCGYKTQTFGDMELHVREKHDQEQLPYRCGICSKGFLKPERVTSHAKCVHNTNVDVVQSQTVSPPSAASDMDCEDADTARTVGHLKKTSRGKFGFPECDKVYTEVRSVEKHILTQHTDMIMPFKCQFKMPYQCQFCPSGFFEQSSLDNHLTHSHPYTTGIRQQKDMIILTLRSVLEKRKASSPVSQRSTKKAKTLENPRSCPICKISFSKPTCVEEHFRTSHPDEPMPYRCMTCLRGFFDADRLQGHCDRVHGIKVTLNQLDQVKMKEEPCESVDDGVDGCDVDSYTSDQDNYQLSVTEPVAVAETAAAHDNDADSYTSDQDVGSSADTLRHNLIHTMLPQPTMLSEGSSFTSANQNQQLSQVQSRGVVRTEQAFSNVIVIEPETDVTAHCQ